MLWDTCAEAGKELDFSFIYMDGQRTIINASRAIFETAQIIVCHFYVSDSQRRYAKGNGMETSTGKKGPKNLLSPQRGLAHHMASHESRFGT